MEQALHHQVTMRHPRQSAFTVVELIIVLGIIILLAGLLFPLIGRAKEAGKRAQCLSNLRSLTQAWLAYAADNQRHICSSDPTTPQGWYNRIPSLDPNHLGPLQTGKLYPYVNDLTVFRCPDDSSVPNDQNAPPTKYAMNGLLNGPIGIPYTFTKLEDIQNAPN